MSSSRAEQSAKQNAPDDDGGLPVPETDFVDVLRFPLFMLAFVLTLLFFDPLQRIALLFGVNAQQRVVIWLNRTLCATLRIVGATVEVVGEAEHLPSGVPYIIVSNHQSLFDIPILHTIFARHRPRFIAKQELAKWLPSVSFNLRNGGSAVIDRSNARQALPAIKDLGERMTAKNFAAVIFPEGTRARRGVLKPFRPAGISTLISTADTARIIPVVLDNSWILSARKFGPIPRGVVVRVLILAELDRNGLKGQELVEKAETVVREGLQRLRDGGPKK